MEAEREYGWFPDGDDYYRLQRSYDAFDNKRWAPIKTESQTLQATLFNVHSDPIPDLRICWIQISLMIFISTARNEMSEWKLHFPLTWSHDDLLIPDAKWFLKPKLTEKSYNSSALSKLWWLTIILKPFSGFLRTLDYKNKGTRLFHPPHTVKSPYHLTWFTCRNHKFSQVRDIPATNSKLPTKHIMHFGPLSPGL